jgi:hypothetical protein
MSSFETALFYFRPRFFLAQSLLTLGASTAVSAFIFLSELRFTINETDRVTNFMKTYLGHIPFYIIDCLIYGNLCRLNAPLKLLQPLDTPENPAERIGYAGGCLGARFSKFRRRYLSVQCFTIL